jgi:uncharacterized membrane protein
MKTILIKVIAVLFILAGINHFFSPEFYLPLIPDYLPYPHLLNATAGALEILIGALIWIARYRRAGGFGLAILMVLFIPAHVHFIHIGHCIPDGLCVDPWIGWLRLLVIQPALIALGFWIARQTPILK